MRLKDKIAVVYGAGGAIGGAVARAFAREGAKLFLTGRRLAPLEAVANEIVATGGIAETAQVDALDERAVDRHLQSVVDKARGVDVSFNAIGIPNTKLQGVPLIDLGVEQFALPIETYTTANFLTARLAARRMVSKRSGVILTVTPIVARKGVPLLGGFAPAMAAVEALTRGLSAELASHGVGVVGVRPDGIPETGTIKEVFGLHAKAHGISWEQFHGIVAGLSHRQRLLTLAEVANVAAFLVSDEASALSGTIANLTLGALDD
jgi:NAD(P)-dependent dehydrogenase (short-subunit alcohol dehydrogenase family)